MESGRRQSVPLKSRLAIYEADDPTMLNRLFLAGFVFPPLWLVGTGYCVSSVESNKTLMRQAGMRNAVMSILSLLLLATLYTGHQNLTTVPHGERKYWDFTHPYIENNSPTGWENVGHDELLWRHQSVTKAKLMTGGGLCMYASANFERLVLGFLSRLEL